MVKNLKSRHENIRNKHRQQWMLVYSVDEHTCEIFRKYELAAQL